ncbi:hypothetical protein ElyMa_001471000 [Elysia marginata]|uniref:HNH endonuclease n=1 Tax=Elysia marginata TaxID=1093978 RepID=A0AAV4J5Z0_9GAST|nr:hypothetical protein ElyMa_001471000 [Elysia marginata]
MTYPRTNMDDLIEELLAEMPAPRDHQFIDPAPRDHQFIDLDDQVPFPVQLPDNAPWVELINDAKDEFEVDGAAVVFSSWRVAIVKEGPLTADDADEADDFLRMYDHITDEATAYVLDLFRDYHELDACITDERAARLLNGLPDGEYLIKIKFLRVQGKDEWTLEDKLDPVRTERKKGQEIVAISRGTKPGALTGIDSVYYQNSYPITATVYGLYPIRDPDPENLAPMKDGDLNCVAQRVVEHFEGALRGQGLTPTRRLKLQAWEERVHETGATVDDVSKLEKILKRAIILRDIAGEDIYNSGKYQGWHRPVELVCHNGHAWPKDLRFPQSREVRLYEGDVWQAIQEATQGEPLAVWLLGGQHRSLEVDQFVLQDGRTFRTEGAHKRLQAICQALGDPALAEKTFGENHAASCRAMREALPDCLGWGAFVEVWKPGDLILTSRQKVRNQVQRLLFQKHKASYPNTSVPLLYHPQDSRKQNILVTIPGTDRQEELVLNDTVDVALEAAEAAIQTDDWRLGYSISVHFSQGLTIHNPQKVWIVDDYLQWSNLAYLAVSRVEYMRQLARVACPPEEGSIAGPPSEQQMRKAIQKKLVAYKRQDRAKGLAGFDLKVDHILQLKEAQNNRCSACNIELLWVYPPEDTQQFSVDRLDNSRGHSRGNVRLTCLDCNRKRGYAALAAEMDAFVDELPRG